jgi:hypothetical protein
MATVRFIGAAQDIQQVTTYTITGTWAANDTCSLKINNKVLTLTLGTDIATTDVAAELAAMINARSATAGRTGANADEIRNFGGQEIAEWTEVVASASGSVLTLKSTAGVPVTITCTQTTAGNGAIESATDGTFKAGTTVTAATGKHFFNNADNWEGGVLPSAGDTLLFDQGSVDVLYGLDNATESYNLTRTNGYSGNIGLLPTNSLGYVEYRQRFLDLPNTATTGTQSINIGDLDSQVPPAGRTFLDLKTNDGVGQGVTIKDAPARTGSLDFPVQIRGGVDVSFVAYSGGCAVGCDTAHSATTTITSAAVHGDASVKLGSKSQLKASGTFELTGGRLINEGTPADSTGVINCYGGALDIRGTFATLNGYGGLMHLRGATITQVNLHSGARLHETETDSTVNNLDAYEGAEIVYPKGNINFSVSFQAVGCPIEKLRLQTPWGIGLTG